MKKLCIGIASLMVMMFLGCAGTQVKRVSEPQLDITGKKIFVIVDEPSMYENLTLGLDSVWASHTSLNIETQFIYNQALTITPVTVPHVVGQCAGSYAMLIRVGSINKSSSSDGFLGDNYSSVSTVEYVSTMYSCDTRKIVWKMIVQTNGGFPKMAKSELVMSIAKDFQTNNIVRSK